MLEWTGERYIPWMEVGEVHYNHLHRYLFAVEFCKGKRVLDLGCGEGYGPNILASVAKEVVGIDIDETTVNHAHNKYTRSNLKFLCGSVIDVPIHNQKYDVIVSFELLEHIDNHDQYIAEVKRLLANDGLFIVSTPNKTIYTDEPNAINPYHKKELYLNEFTALLNENFTYSRILGQRSFTGSNIWSISSNEFYDCDELWVEKKDAEYELANRDTKRPIIFIALASNISFNSEFDHTYKWLIDTSNSLILSKNKQIEILRNSLKAKESELMLIQNQLKDKTQIIDEQVKRLDTYQRSFTFRLLNYYLTGLNKVIPPGTQIRNWHDNLYSQVAKNREGQHNAKANIAKVNIRKHKKPKCLGVLLCYNDADILEDVMDHLISNKHDLVVWNHGSDDDTAAILDKYKKYFLEITYKPRSFDFYDLYPAMSRNIIEKFISSYDWISWPDQDEILEGPDRKRTYYEYICDVYNSKYNYVRFNNFTYWFTSEDDVTVLSPVKRIKRYSIFLDCAPRIRAWRASVTNIRQFNHNVVDGDQYPALFNIRHYPMRSISQMQRRLNKDRIELSRGDQNYHYDNFNRIRDKLLLSSDQLNYDDGISDLNFTEKFNWRDIYGYGPSK